MHYKDKTVIQVYIANDTLEELKKCAKEDARTVSNFVNMLITKHIAEKSKENS